MQQSRSTLSARLGPDEIAAFLSPYLTEGRRQEAWRIDEVTIDGERLEARVGMTHVYESPSDPHGFHLTAFSTLEFVSQLVIIYGHVWAGLDRKTREGWLLEASIRTEKAIRERQGIDVTVLMKSIRKVRDNLIGTFEFTVADRLGGSFSGRIKAFLS
ncbi:MAG: hypothetical protein WCR51_00465 [Planctomycetia bacterium]